MISWILRLFVMFKKKGHGRPVAHFCRSKILDWARILIKCFQSELITHTNKGLIWPSIEVYQGFLDYRFHMSVTAFHIHHHGDGNSSGYPVLTLVGKITY